MKLGQINKLSRDERGTVAIIFALVATVTIGIAGSAVDFGRAVSQKSKLQAAADAAAIAGARAVAEEAANPEAVATSMFTVNMPGVVPEVSRVGDGIKVTAGASVATTLLGVMGIPKLDVSAGAMAQAAFETVEEPQTASGNVCVLLLDPKKHHSFLVNGSAYVSAPDCEFHVKSTRPNDSAMINSNVHLDIKRTCNAGVTRINGGGHGVVGPVEDNCDAAEDTIAGTLPQPTIGQCKQSENFNGQSANLTPGTYCGDWNFNGNIKTINLAPGVYVLNNSRWNFNAKMYGTDVTFYFNNSNSYLQINGQGAIYIQAPTSGEYKGILMYENPNIAWTSRITVNGGNDAAIKGLIYLPSRDMTWNGGSGLESDQLTMVLNSLILNGNTTWKLQPFDGFPLAAPRTSEGSTTKTLKSVRLHPL